ncbi:MAG: hypothetical protein LBH32_12215 [Dysgonamonadaceae bacterium]|jgi:hypothetical protein|nr:hypothetical protein [Dysgonamonadaceae bacterium]
METQLNEILVTVVLEHISNKVRPSSYLMETLNLSRESAYRRLRNEIPFTMDEIGALSIRLGFSIDEIIGRIKENRAFFDFFSEKENSCSAFYNMLQKINSNIESLQEDDLSEVVITLNRTLPILRIFYDEIFRFTYFKWLIQSSEIVSNQLFSSIQIPRELAALQKKAKFTLKKIPSVTLILDSNIFSSLVTEIQYYYQRKLIDDTELELLRNDVLKQIESFEQIARTGIFGENTKIDLYLSSLYINANMGYLGAANTQQWFFWTHTTNPVIIHNKEFCSINQKWINSIKRQSVLISESNEMLQSEFFNKQRQWVNQNLSKSG